jgi:hypothetical protein
MEDGTMPGSRCDAGTKAVPGVTSTESAEIRELE